MATTFRPATAADSGFAAGVSNAVDPHHPITQSELLDMWEKTERTADVRRFIAEVDGSPVGWFSYVRRREDSPMVVSLNLLIPEEHAGLLAGAASFLDGQGRKLGAEKLVGKLWAGQARALEVMKRQGWTEERRQRYWRLDLAAHADRLLALRAAAEERLHSASVGITTAARLGGVAIYPELHALDQATVPDIPSSLEFQGGSYEDWLPWMQPPSVLPERIWVASVGEKVVGMSFLEFHPSLVSTGYTGVLREHRNNGIARALKLETLAQAIELGVAVVETDNDSENAPILHLNEKLGYQEVPGRIELHRALT